MVELTVQSKGKAGYRVSDGDGGAWAVKLNGAVSCSCGQPSHLCPHIAAARRWQNSQASNSRVERRTAPQAPSKAAVSTTAVRPPVTSLARRFCRRRLTLKRYRVRWPSMRLVVVP